MKKILFFIMFINYLHTQEGIVVRSINFVDKSLWSSVLNSGLACLEIGDGIKLQAYIPLAFLTSVNTLVLPVSQGDITIYERFILPDEPRLTSFLKFPTRFAFHLLTHHPKSTAATLFTGTLMAILLYQKRQNKIQSKQSEERKINDLEQKTQALNTKVSEQFTQLLQGIDHGIAALDQANYGTSVERKAQVVSLKKQADEAEIRMLAIYNQNEGIIQQLQQSIASLKGTLNNSSQEQEIQINSLDSQIKEITLHHERLAAVISQSAKDINDVQAYLEQISLIQIELRTISEAIYSKQQECSSIIESNTKQLQNAGSNLENLNDQTQDLSEAAADQARMLDDLTASLNDLINSLENNQ